MNGAKFWNCAGGTATYNTISHIRNNNGLQIYFTGDPPPAVPAMAASKQPYFQVAFNRIHDIGFSYHCDCSGVQTRHGAYKGMQHHNNWIYHMPHHKATRFDTGDNGGDLYQNVFWQNGKGFMIKGGMHEGNRIVHNTGFANKDFDISVPNKEYGEGSTNPNKKFNEKSQVFNNAADDWRESKDPKCSKPLCSPPCKANDNSWGQCGWPAVHEMLRDVRVFDFRPRVGSQLVGVAGSKLVQFAPGTEKTIGAYEAANNHYSIPGKVLAQSCSPVPPHGFPAVFSSQDLIFNRGKDALKHDVFLSRDVCEVASAPTGSLSAMPQSPVVVGRFTWPRNVVSPGVLQAGEIYYWRVDAVGQSGSVKGETWCFKVSKSNQDTSLKVPWNLITGRHTCVKEALRSCGPRPRPAPTPRPQSTPRPTPLPVTDPGGAACGTSLERGNVCAGGSIVKGKATSVEMCKKMCEAKVSGKSCCTFYSKKGQCRHHTGNYRFKRSKKIYYSAVCQKASAPTPKPNPAPRPRPQPVPSPGGGSCAASLQRGKICSGGSIDKTATTDADLCKKICEAKISGKSCCTFYSVTGQCRVHTGSYRFERGKKTFYSAECDKF